MNKHTLDDCCSRRVINRDTVIKGDLDVCGDITFQKCFKTQGQLNETLTLDTNCATVNCDVTLNAFEVTVKERTTAAVLVEFPFNSASDGVVAEGDSFVVNGLKVTNVQGTGEQTPPGEDNGSGPWYVEAGTNVQAPDSSKVFTAGLREEFNPGINEDPQPAGDETVSIASMVQDATVPTNSIATFDLHYGYSTEIAFDFLFIKKNGETLVVREGFKTPEDPYVAEVIPGVTLLADDVLTIEFTKDEAWYGGVDSIYFYPKNLTVGPIPTPTTVTMIRDGQEVFNLNDYAGSINEIPVGSSSQFVKSFDFKKDDQICLIANPELFSTYKVCVTVAKQVTTPIYDDQTQKSCLNTNGLSYNSRKPTSGTEVGGWYETDGDEYYYIEDQGFQLVLNRYFVDRNGKNHMNNVFTSILVWEKFHENYYGNSEQKYIYDPNLREFRADLTDSSSVEILLFNGDVAGVFRKVAKPDERFWKYFFDIEDPDHIFNSPRATFNAINDLFSGMFNATAFGSESRPTMPDINPLHLDEMHVERAFGCATKHEMEDLYHRLRDQGILRKYGVKRFVYWPDPKGPVIDNKTEEALQWFVNQQRSNYLAFVCNNPEEDQSPRGYAKLCPGENVVMKGSGTRLDNVPLVLATDGYHTGPKPAREFVPDYQYDNWSFYTIRLPLVVNSNNDTIYYSYVGDSDIKVTIDHGNYTIRELMVEIENKAISALSKHETVIEGFGTSIQSLIFYDLFLSAFSGRIFFDATSNTNLKANSPTHPTNASSLFGPQGLDVGYVFGSEDTTAIGSTNVENSSGGAVDGTNLNVGFAVDLDQFGFGNFNPDQRFTTSGKLVVVDPIDASDPDDVLNPDQISGNIAIIKFNDAGRFPYDDAVYVASSLGARGVIVFRDGFDVPQSEAIFVFGASGRAISILMLGDTDAQNLIAKINPGVTEITMRRGFGPMSGTSPFGYRSHTPLTNAEATALVKNMANVTVEATHGPVSNDMNYRNFVACLGELSWGYSTEVHNIIAPYCQPADSGVFEIFNTQDELLSNLNHRTLPDTAFTPYTMLGDRNQPFNSSLIRVLPLRVLGTGHPAEFSEMYIAGEFRDLAQRQTRQQSRLEWQFPNNRQYYAPGTMVNIGGKVIDIGNTQVQQPFINYLEDPRWLVSRAGTLGEPTFQFDAFDTHQFGAEDGAPFATNDNLDGSPLTFNPDIVSGDWLIGIFKDSALTRANVEANVKVGYITHSWSGFSWAGDVSLLNWYDPNFQDVDQAARQCAGTIIKYFNEHNVQHIVMDIRNTGGGFARITEALTNLIGGDRTYNAHFNQTTERTIKKIRSIEANEVIGVSEMSNLQKYAEDEGLITYKNVKSALDCKPSDYEALQGPSPLDFPENSTFKGESAENPKRIIWLTNSTTISGTQDAYMQMKSSSLVQDSSKTNGFDGNLGGNVHMIGYGCYYRPFACGNNYRSFVNWYGKNRAGSEIIRNPLVYNAMVEQTQQSAYSDGGVLKTTQQDFSRMHQPQIKWNMNADIFFKDIGYTKNAGVPPEDGKPWADKRYDDVDWTDPLTWRDSTLDRCLQIATDPNVKDHYFKDDGYGDI